jgi:hypothetical protein
MGPKCGSLRGFDQIATFEGGPFALILEGEVICDLNMEVIASLFGSRFAEKTREECLKFRLFLEQTCFII